MNQKQGTTPGRRSSSGGIFLFIAFLLPVLLFSIIIVVEVTTISFSTNALQANLDSAIISAAQRLPDVDEAKRSFAKVFPARQLDPDRPLSPKSSVLIAPDSIEASVSIPNRRSLLAYFGVEKSFSTTAHAKAIIPPLTVSVALDTSSYTAPSPSEPTWPSSHLLPAGLFLQDSDLSGARAALSPLQHTQGCFSPLLLPLKRLAVETVASLERVPSYRLAAVTFPNSTVGMEANAGVSEVKVISRREPTWVSYESLHRSNATCAAAALHDTLYHPESPYRFPRRSSRSFGGLAPSGERIVDMEARTFNPSYAPFLSVEEVLWSQAAREGDGIGTVAAIESLGRFIISEHRSMKVSAPVRGKQAVVGLLFAGDVPRSSGDRFPSDATKLALKASVMKLAELATEADVNLYLPYILFQNSTGVTIEEGEELSAFLALETALTPQVRIPVLMTRDEARLEEKLLPLLKNLRKPIVLSQ